MVADGLGSLGLVGVVAVLLFAAGFWRWGRSQRTEVSLTEAVRRGWREHAPATATLHVDLPDGATVYADPTELDALLAELFENAVTYGGTEVTVRVGPTDSGFAVADDGSGIPVDDRDRVFERGFTTRPDRDGLGLALVASICAGNGWEVGISERDGGGTRVEIAGVQFRDGWGDAASDPVAIDETAT